MISVWAQKFNPSACHSRGLLSGFSAYHVGRTPVADARFSPLLAEEVRRQTREFLCEEGGESMVGFGCFHFWEIYAQSCGHKARAVE